MRIAALLAVVAFLQLGWTAQVQAQKNFDVQYLGLLNASLRSSAKVYAGQSPMATIKALGTPSGKTRVYFEMEEDTADVYYYQTNKLYFLRGSLAGFELNDSTLAFGKSLAQAFRVGGLLTTDTKLLNSSQTPASPRYLLNDIPLKELKLDTNPGTSRNINYTLIARNKLRHGDEKYDGWFEILFDANNRVISIALGE